MKDQNAEVEPELARPDDSISVIEKRVNALQVELRESKQAISMLPVENTNRSTTSSDVTMGLRQIETQVGDTLNVVPKSVKDVQNNVSAKMCGI